jgi:predicted ATP-dependent serine protease
MSLYGNNPCRDCEERHEGCHGKCEKYTSWRDVVNEKKNSIYQARKGEALASSFTIDEVFKIRAKKYKKKRGQF